MQQGFDAKLSKSFTNDTSEAVNIVQQQLFNFPKNA